MSRCLVLVIILISNAILATAQFTLDMDKPPEIATMLGEGKISTGLRERDFALSPDGSHLFYTLQSPRGVFQTILYCNKDAAGKWSMPVVAPFAGRFSDLEPAFSADGNTLYFASNRPLQGSMAKDFDIWMVIRTENGWTAPVNLGAPVNTPADEYFPAIAQSGNLYFTAAYTEGRKEDIYKAIWEKGKFVTVEPLDTAINSATYEFNAYVSPDEQFIIFTSFGRKDDKGGGDLYMSRKDNSGNWKPARNLSIVNSDKIDYCPFVSFDKKVLFFTSERMNVPAMYNEPVTYDGLVQQYNAPLNGGGNIYWINMKMLE